MKTLSPLAVQILPMLFAPMCISEVLARFADDTTGEEVEAALDELTPALATCDEDGAGVPYYYRRDIAAEKARALRWNARRSIAERRRDEAIKAANQAFEQAIAEADADRDASDPMAAIKAKVAA